MRPTPLWHFFWILKPLELGWRLAGALAVAWELGQGLWLLLGGLNNGRQAAGCAGQGQIARVGWGRDAVSGWGQSS